MSNQFNINNVSFGEQKFSQRLYITILFITVMFSMMGCGTLSINDDYEDKNTLHSKYKYSLGVDVNSYENGDVSSFSSSIDTSTDLPICDNTNPEVHFIRSNDDWKMINSSDKSIFCVSPGDYSSLGQIKLSTSGTAQNPRYIILDNGNDRHPAKLSKNQLAKYILLLENADYWVIDRQAYWETTDPFKRNALKASSYNIFSRAYFLDTSSAYVLHHKSTHNIIQMNHIEKTQWSVNKKSFHDTAAINLLCVKDKEYITDTSIINNEIINYVDSIQTVRLYDAAKLNAEIDFSGTLISDNLLYVTDIMYSNGNGKSNISGDKSFTENAIDLKGGASHSNNPVVVKNNVMWGFKRSDNTYSNLSDAGSAIVVHYDVRNVIFENNVIFKSDFGFMGGEPRGDRYPLEDSILRNNIFFQIKSHAISIYGTEKQGTFDGAKNVEIKDNFFAQSGEGVIKLYNTDNVNIENNIFADSKQLWFGGSKSETFKSNNLRIENNEFYNMDMGIATYVSDIGNEIIGEDAPYDKYNVNIISRKFTTEQKEKQLFVKQ